MHLKHLSLLGGLLLLIPSVQITKSQKADLPWTSKKGTLEQPWEPHEANDKNGGPPLVNLTATTKNPSLVPQKVQNINQAQSHINKQVAAQNKRKASITKTTPKVSYPPKPAPDLSFKENVVFRASHPDFILGESADATLVVRHAPIPEKGSLWPMPQNYAYFPDIFLVNHWGFQFLPIKYNCEVLHHAVARIKRNVFDLYNNGLSPSDTDIHVDSSMAVVSSLNMTVIKECDQYPSLEMDESYDLVVKANGVTLLAREVWGAIRGLETFSQLVFEDTLGRLVIRRATVKDFPRFPHRGILLDTARHYLDKETIINNLEAMAQNKMNVFHWHMVDDQSFPFQSKVFPNLTKYGAYDSNTHVYTHEDIRDIIHEARIRGIRIIPEFDTPGHTLAWGYGTPHLLTPCYRYERTRNIPNGLFGPINPALNSTYIFLETLFREVLSLFPDKYLHLGGDEVPFSCWLSNPQITEFKNSMGFSSGHTELLNYYETRLLEIVQKLGHGRAQSSGSIVWQEVYQNNVKLWNDTIVQLWLAHLSEIPKFAARGQRVLYSSCWYLDWIGYGVDWTKYYLCQHGTSDLTLIPEEDEKLLLGGEASLWMEYADDANALTRLWPRATTAAERLWSSKTVKDPIKAGPRIEEQRCRMKRHGLPVGVLSGPGHCPRTLAERKHQPVMDISDRLVLQAWKSLNPPAMVQSNAGWILVAVATVLLLAILLFIIAQLSHRDANLTTVTGWLSVAQPRRIKPKTVMVVFLSFVVIWSLWIFPFMSKTYRASNTVVNDFFYGTSMSSVADGSKISSSADDIT